MSTSIDQMVLGNGHCSVNSLHEYSDYNQQTQHSVFIEPKSGLRFGQNEERDGIQLFEISRTTHSITQN